MKNTLTKVAFFVWIFIFFAASGQAQFQRQFGTNLGESFSKVIPSEGNYYVLGNAEVMDGQPAQATVSRLNALGELQWTLSLNVASQWNDAVLTPSGSLLVVGYSLPDDNTSRSIMGLVTAAGAFSWVRSYDLPQRDGFLRIARNPVPQNAAFPYYVLGSQTDVMTSNTDMFLLNLSESGALNWKKLYFGPIFFNGNKIPHDLEALPNGDLLISANLDAQGVIMRADNAGQPFNGVTPDGAFVFEDLAQGSGGTVYATGTNLQNGQHYVMKFDADLIGLWDVILEGVSEIRQVLPAGGIYVLAKKGFKECANRLTETGGAPTLDWVKFLDNGFTTTTAGAMTLTSLNQLAYADGRTPVSGGFGQLCGFVSLSGLDLDPCFTTDDDGAVFPGNLLYSGPLLPDADFYDLPASVNLTGSLRTWQQGNACQVLMNASVIGVKYKECNGLPYGNQTPIAGWVIQLLDSGGIIIGEQVTDADGRYAFEGLPPGQYLVKEIAQPGWTPNVPASGQLAVTLAVSEQRIVNFGNCPPPQLLCACPAGSQPANNNLAANGNFTAGNTGFSSGYTFSNTPPLQAGQFWVGANPSQINAGFTNCGDHTTGSGNMLVVNGGGNTSTPIWCQTYTVTPNSSYIFEAWVASLTSASPANLMLFVNGISQNAGFFASGTSCNWEKYCVLWTSGVQTSVTLCLYDLNVANSGNDFALDDISFRRCVASIGDLSGHVYRTCDSLPYTNQPVLSGWTVQLLDDIGTVLAEQVTGANGEYAFNDLPSGQYTVRAEGRPGWTANVPPTGMYAISLNSPEPVISNFGMCQECSCDSLFTFIHQEFGTTDTSTYQLSIFNNGINCFPYLEVVVDTGLLIGWMDVLTDWEAELINAQTLRLVPPDDYIPEGYLLPARLIIAGSGTHSMRTMTAVMGFACTAGSERAFPSPPVSPGSSCCPSWFTAGPEMVINGEFNNPVLPSSDYSPRVGSLSPGEIDIMDQTQAFASNNNWVCPGKTGVNDKFLAADGSGQPATAAWKQQINASQLIADRNYVFCFQTSNMVKTSKSPYADPRLFMQIVDDTNAGVVWTGGPYVIPESPKTWVPISMNWTAPANLSASYTLKIFTTPYNTDYPGNDFALDCISFRECIPPCTASITTTNIDNCGHVQLNAVASGLSGYSYQWCSGESTQMLDLMLPCGEHDFCVSVTCADGTVASDAITVTVTDNIPPTINCPQNMTITALHPNCDMPVHGIHSLGAADNCGIPTVTYAISGTTTASGQGDASGTTFNSGTSTVTYTATDWCNNMTSCSFDITIECDTCACLGFQNMEFYNFLGAPNIPTTCNGASVPLPCIGSDALYWFQWQLNCSDPLCVQSTTYVIVPAAGGPPVLSGSIPLGSPPFLSFSYNQLGGAGNYQLILTGNCGGDECTCIINFSVPSCCNCGGFSDMTWRPTQGGFTQFVACGDTLAVPCNQTFFPQVGGMFQCVGTQCPTNQTIQWVLQDPAGNPIQSGPITFQTNFLLALDPAWFVQAGTYTLTFNGNCAGQMCPPCVLYLESLGCPDLCCGFTDLFINEPNGTNLSIACDGPPVNIGCPPPGGNYTLTGKYGGGPTIQAILVNACGTEANNEFMILYSGGKGFNVNDLEVDFDPTGNTGSPQDNDINLGAAACGWQSGEAGMLSGCPNVIVAGPGTFIPADAYLVIQTSSAASNINLYDFSNLCSAPRPVYLIRNACARTSNAFSNVGLGLHTTVISLDGTCVDSATYNHVLLSNINGDYFLPPATYGNAGCFAPPYAQFNNNLSYQINWTLVGPSGTQNNQLTGNSPYFALNLPSSYFSQGGLYTLTLDGQNGNDSCQCSLTFMVDNGCPDPCPCDLADLTNDVSQGFATAYATNSCKACFTPLGLTDCDEVEWMINSPISTPVGTSIGNQTFCYAFPVGGNYTVYMTVIRRRADGSLCESSVKSQTVTVACLARAVCEVSAFPNPDFEEGAVLGSFLEGGMTAGWTRIWGDPHVEVSHGKKVIKKRGNFSSADVIGTIEPVCLAKETGTIILGFGIKEQGIKSAIVVQFFTGDVYEFGVCESATCYEVARIELPDPDNPDEEFDLEIPYNIGNWEAMALCGDQTGVSVRPAIFVTSPFSDEQGPGGLTEIDLAYFCVDGDVVNALPGDPKVQPLRIYPNPNSGAFTLELSQAATPDMTFRIIGLTGRVLLEKRAEAGSARQALEAGVLPSGLYFVQVIEDGRVVGGERVVKQ